MGADTGQSVLFVLGTATSAVAFIGLLLGLNKLLSPRNPTSEKLKPYECGMDCAGRPWQAVDIKFASIAVLLVIFDAEAALLFAVATGMKDSVAGLIEVGAIVALLAFGLFYAWRKGVLQWRS